MSDFYDVTGAPATSAALSSATIRAEFALIAAAFAKLPALTGNGNKILAVNSAGTAVEATASLTGPISIAANSSSTALKVYQTGAGNTVEFGDSTDPDATPWIIDANGVVIKGHTAAVTSLNYQGSSFTPGQQVHGNTVPNSASAIFGWNGPAGLYGHRSNSSTIGAHSVVSDTNTLYDMIGEGSDGAAFVRAAMIRMSVDGTPASGIVPGQIGFWTARESDGALLLRAYIDADGLLTASGYVSSPRYYVSGSNPLLEWVDTDAAVDEGHWHATAGTARTWRLQALTDAGAGGGTVLDVVRQAGSNSLDYIGIGATSDWTFKADITNGTNYGHGFLGTKPTKGIGYGTGAGGTVTQATSRTTGVTVNKVCGQITLVSAAGSATWQSFTVTNSAVAATDTVRINQVSGTDKYMAHITAVGAGSFQVTFATTGGTTTEQPVFNFTVIKGVTS